MVNKQRNKQTLEKKCCRIHITDTNSTYHGPLLRQKSSEFALQVGIQRQHNRGTVIKTHVLSPQTRARMVHGVHGVFEHAGAMKHTGAQKTRNGDPVTVCEAIEARPR